MRAIRGRAGGAGGGGVGSMGEGAGRRSGEQQVQGRRRVAGTRDSGPAVAGTRVHTPGLLRLPLLSLTLFLTLDSDPSLCYPLHLRRHCFSPAAVPRAPSSPRRPRPPTSGSVADGDDIVPLPGVAAAASGRAAPLLPPAPPAGITLVSVTSSSAMREILTLVTC